MGPNYYLAHVPTVKCRLIVLFQPGAERFIWRFSGLFVLSPTQHLSFLKYVQRQYPRPSTPWCYRFHRRLRPLCHWDTRAALLRRAV